VQAAGVVCVAAGRVLLLRRSSQVPQAGFWSIPAGALERTESPLDAAVRELREETGYVGSVRVVGAAVDPVAHFYYVFASAPRRFALRLNWENDLGDWFTPRSLPRPLYPGLKTVLDQLR
jgi:8-oxo-dGTP pyrophosphatase MutT (NUDIX family)